MASNPSKATLIDYFMKQLSKMSQSDLSKPQLDVVVQSTLDYVKELKDSAPSLPISNIEYDDVFEMFNLTKNIKGIWSLEQHDLYSPSKLMTDMLDETKFVVQQSKKNEAYARCVLNSILICCVAEEKRMASSIVQINSSTAASTDPTRPSTPNFDPLERADLCLRFETPLKYRVIYKKKARMLSGIADYTLWYDNKESMGTNLIVVEAKRNQAITEAATQLVAYMAIIHATRRREGKLNSVVYGISSDGNAFQFWRIDNESVVSQSMIIEWRVPYFWPQITSYIRFIIRAAVASSPTTTPVKGKQNRKVTMSFFKNPDKGEGFDFGIGHLGVEDDDDFDDDMNIVDLSGY